MSRAFSPRGVCGLRPGALPQAGMDAGRCPLAGRDRPEQPRNPDDRANGAGSGPIPGRRSRRPFGALPLADRVRPKQHGDRCDSAQGVVSCEHGESFARRIRAMPHRPSAPKARGHISLGQRPRCAKAKGQGLKARSMPRGHAHFMIWLRLRRDESGFQPSRCLRS